MATVPATLVLDAGDLERLLAPLLVGDGLRGLRLAHDGEALAVVLQGVDPGRFLPAFDLHLRLVAGLADARTVRLQAQAGGLAGVAQNAFSLLGGLPWLVRRFIDHPAVAVGRGGVVDIHLDRLPAAAAGWLAGRLTLTALAAPGAADAALSAAFTVNPP